MWATNFLEHTLSNSAVPRWIEVETIFIEESSTGNIRIIGGFDDDPVVLLRHLSDILIERAKTLFPNLLHLS